MNSHRRQITVGCVFLLGVMLSGCTKTSHGNDGAASSVSNVALTPAQHVVYTGISKHWTGRIEGLSHADSNVNQTSGSIQTLTVKYRDPNSVPTGETVRWSLQTPSEKNGIATVSKSGEASCHCDVRLPQQLSSLTLTVKWGSQTETLQLRHSKEQS